MTTPKITSRISAIYSAAERLAEAFDKANHTFVASNAVAEIQTHLKYSEPGYSSSELIMTGNWNSVSASNGKVFDVPSRMARILSKMYVSAEWSDEWSTCECCDGLVRVHPDSYSWKPFFEYTGDEIVCLTCKKESEE